jgi:sugar phosphate isomerase/epimerase
MSQRSEMETSVSTTEPRPAIQLYTLRRIDESLPDTIRRVAAAGYEGVEFANQFLTADPEDVRSALEETGMVPVAAHVGLSELEANPEAIIDRCRRVGCRRIVIPHLGAGYFRTTDRIDSLAARLDSLATRLDADGIELSYHTNRASFLPPVDQAGLGPLSNIPLPGSIWELIADGLARAFPSGDADIASETAFGRLVEGTSENLTFEVDVGWVAAAGYDPAAVFELLGDRMALVHVADVVETRGFPPAFRSAPPGEGILDLDRVVSAARRTGAEWLVFEDDDPPDSEGAVGQGIAIVQSPRNRDR